MLYQASQMQGLWAGALCRRRSPRPAPTPEAVERAEAYKLVVRPSTWPNTGGGAALPLRLRAGRRERQLDQPRPLERHARRARGRRRQHADHRARSLSGAGDAGSPRRPGRRRAGRWPLASPWATRPAVGASPPAAPSTRSPPATAGMAPLASRSPRRSGLSQKRRCRPDAARCELEGGVESLVGAHLLRPAERRRRSRAGKAVTRPAGARSALPRGETAVSASHRRCPKLPRPRGPAVRDMLAGREPRCRRPIASYP